MLRLVRIALVLSVAAYCLLGMVANLADWPRTLGSIRGVVSMATVPGGPAHWQATGNPAVVIGAALLIVVLKIAAGLLCLGGARRMWRLRDADRDSFAQAKTLAVVGCGMAMLGLHLGWTVIGEQVFDLWRSTVFAQSANTAFRYGASIALIALFVGMRED